MGKAIKIILFLIVVVIVLVYFFRHADFDGKPKERIQSPISSSGDYTFPTGGTSVTGAPSPVSVTSPGPEISSAEPEIPDSLIPSGYTRDQLSPYFNKIKISSAYASSYGSYPTQIKIYSSLTKGETANVTGWRIKTNRAEFSIPQAIKVYDFSGLTAEQDIVVSSGSYVNIYSNRSPINKNFQLNKCTGYLENHYNFNPSLPQNCPSISRSEISHLSGQCQSYIISLWGCKEPDVSFYNSLPGNEQGNACRDFLSTINSASCVRKHRWDSDFLSNERRIWLNWNTSYNILDSQHDRVLLFDKEGLLVDEYSY